MKLSFLSQLFLSSIRDCNIQDAQKYLNQGANINAQSLKTCESALHYSINCNENISLWLINSGIDINLLNRNGYTALFYTSWSGNLAVAKLLVDQNVKWTRDRNGLTPLFFASYYGHLELVSLFFNKGFNINEQSNLNWTCLHEAVINRKVEIVKFLLEKGAQTETYAQLQNNEDITGGTPLLFAVFLSRSFSNNRFSKHHLLNFPFQESSFQIINLLIEYRANINIADKESGKRPLHFAVESFNSQVLLFLIQAGANIQATDYIEGRNALHYACRNGNLEAVIILVNHGGKFLVNRGDWNGVSPVCLATNVSRNQAIVRFLYKNGGIPCV